MMWQTHRLGGQISDFSMLHLSQRLEKPPKKTDFSATPDWKNLNFNQLPLKLKDWGIPLNPKAAAEAAAPGVRKGSITSHQGP